jgi:hypothetical protein
LGSPDNNYFWSWNDRSWFWIWAKAKWQRKLKD